MRAMVICGVAALLSGCSALLNAQGYHIDSARGDTIVISEADDPYRPPQTYRAASDYCAKRGAGAVLRATSPRLGDVRAFIYDCIRRVERRGGGGG